MEEPRVALVTGGGRGIGLAAAERLLNDGFLVAILDVNERVLDSARLALGHPDEVVCLYASVSDPAAVSGVVAEIVGRWERIDVLVNNAAINRPGGLFEQSLSDWGAVLTVNLTGPFVVSAAVAPRMRQQRWGSIVNVGSIGAAGFGASPAYAASKAGLIGLTRQQARELGVYNITANYVAPGVTLTDWVERNLGQERIEASAAATPMGRVGTPGDIAGVIAFLASDDARHVTGQVISVSGGVWMP